jgi:23S rRNA pseudouridine955/2504/2580 synthase
MKFQKVKNIKVDLESKGMRLDNYLISLLKGIPKSKIYSIIRKGEVRLNSKRIQPKHKIEEGDIVRIPPLKIIENETVKPSRNIVEIIKERIIFEDKSILVINKPVGIASHGGSGISLGLIEIVRQIIPSYENVQLVHRLDKDTSGCIVLTKKKSVLREMHNELRNHSVEKKYVAITKGHWQQNSIDVNLNLLKLKNKSGEQKVKVSDEGKESITKFKVIKQNKNFSQINCTLLTGKTHQIRVHCQYLEHPIMGDRKYGDKDFNKLAKKIGITRMMLHASSINFKRMKFSIDSQIPEEFLSII